jgi:HD-GYP domain-containing protein (c-di-GMP phosphodiesterase class II)
MDKVILTPAGDTAAQEAAASAGDGVVAAEVAAGGAPPCPAAGVLASPDFAAEGIRLALAAAREHEAVLELLAEAIDVREAIPPGSAARLREHATRFAEAMGLSREERLALERAALLRAIGKLRISNDILLKKSVLDYDEWMHLKQYPVLGADLLAEMGICTDAIEAVRYHQECFDGTGYPAGIEGEEIPLLARMLKILVVYCAMTSPRHYRSSVTSHEDAIAYFSSERGKHYDDELVDVFIAHGIGQPPEA